MKIGLQRPDAWTATHLFGSFFLAHAISFLFPSADALFAPATALVVGIFWEYLDSLFAGLWIFDPRGGDWQDIAADAVGCVLAIWV